MARQISGSFSVKEVGGDRFNRVSDRVARQLALELLDSRYPEGTMLPPESQLMKQLGCSRVALRGALRSLENWGLIAIQMGRNGGPVVRRPRAGDLRDGLAVLMHYENASFLDVILARRAIDPIIAAEAARNATSDQISGLEATVDAMMKGGTNHVQFLRSNAEFHHILGEAARLVVLAAFLSTLTSIGDSSIMLRLPFDAERRQSVATAHKKVVKYIHMRDPEGAHAAMLEHRKESEWYWRDRAPGLVDMPLRPFAESTPPSSSGFGSLQVRSGNGANTDDEANVSSVGQPLE